MFLEATPILQAMGDLGQAFSEAIRSAAIGLWDRDELLFIAVVMMLIQACWILSLRYRLRRTRKKLHKALSQAKNAESEQPVHADGSDSSLHTAFAKTSQAKVVSPRTLLSQ